MKIKTLVSTYNISPSRRSSTGPSLSPSPSPNSFAKHTFICKNDQENNNDASKL